MELISKHLKWILAFSILAFLISINANSAEAHGIPLILLFGANEKVVKLTDASNPLIISAPEVGNVSFDVGYAYKQFNIFLMPIHSWGGKFVLMSPYMKNAYYELQKGDTEEVISAAGYDTRKSPMSFMATHWGALVLATLIGGYFIWKKGKEDYWW